MNIIKNEMTFFVDIDETIFCWADKKSLKTIGVKDPNDFIINYGVPHLPHIKILKNKKTRGAYVVVWSAGGYAWAEAVVTALGLQDYVDQIMTKPSSYMDDKLATEFMGERIYLPIDSNYR